MVEVEEVQELEKQLKELEKSEIHAPRYSPKKKSAFAKNWKDLVFYCCVLAFPILQFCIFYLGVNVNSILLAFKSYETVDSYTWTGFDNFKNLFVLFGERTMFWTAFKNSLIMFAVGTGCGLSLGMIFSYYIFKKGVGSGFFKIMLFLPSIIPSIALIVMFKQFADGAVPAIMKMFGLESQGLLSNPDTTFGTIIFYNVFISFGTGILMYVGAMENIPTSVFEAAKLDGASFFIEFIKIVLPLVWGTFATFLVVNVGSIFINQANIYAFYGPGAEESIYTIGYYLYIESVAVNAYASYPQLSAFGLMLSFITIPLVYGTKYLCDRFGPSTER